MAVSGGVPLHHLPFSRRALEARLRAGERHAGLVDDSSEERRAATERDDYLRSLSGERALGFGPMRREARRLGRELDESRG